MKKKINFFKFKKESVEHVTLKNDVKSIHERNETNLNED
jgi:hypothetical protein